MFELPIGESDPSKENLKSEYEELLGERSKIENEQRDIFSWGNFAREGGQELIKIFGIERVATAITEIKKLENHKNIYELIKLLEPDKQKRIELYSKIDKFAREELKEFTEKNENEEISPNLKMTFNSFGPSENNIRDLNFKLESFEQLDELSTIKALPEKVISKIESLINRCSISNKEEARFTLVSFEDFDVKNFKEQLQKHKNNIVELSAEKYEQIDIKKGNLRDKETKFALKVGREKVKIIQEFQKNFLHEISKLTKDLQQVIETNKETGDENQKNIVDNVIKNIEEKIEESYKKHEESIKKKTEDHIKMLQDLMRSTTLSLRKMI